MAFVRSDLEFILAAIKAAEGRARSAPPGLAEATPLWDPGAEPLLRAPSIDEDRAAWMTLFSHFFDYRFEAAQPVGPGARFAPLGEEGAHQGQYVVFQDFAASPDADHGAGLGAGLYDSHPTRLALLRAYVLEQGAPVATGALLAGAEGGAPLWSDIVAQARETLGVALRDEDAADAPLFATDAFGALLLSPRGRAQLVGPQGLIEGDPDAPVDSAQALRSGATLAHLALSAAGFAEHNLLAQSAKTELVAIGDHEFLGHWLRTPVETAPRTAEEVAALDWDGDRLFHTARFAAEAGARREAFEADLAPTSEFGAENTLIDLSFLAELARQAAETEAEEAALHFASRQTGQPPASGEVVVVLVEGDAGAGAGLQSDDGFLFAGADAGVSAGLSAEAELKTADDLEQLNKGGAAVSVIEVEPIEPYDDPWLPPIDEL